MNESDLQARYRKTSSSRELYHVGGRTMPLDPLQSLVKSLLDSGKTHDALHVYTRAYSSDYQKPECLEIFIEGIAQKARENIKENKKMSLDLFICYRCHDIIKDPVTLKCGHTLSKKCVLAEAKDDSFKCPKCGQSYCVSYLSDLKNNVTILSLVEKLSEILQLKLKNNFAAINGNSRDRTNEADTYLFNCREDSLQSEVEVPSLILRATTSAGYFTKGRLLLNFGNFKEAFKAYMTCFVLDSYALPAKRTATEVLHRLLRNLVPHSNISLEKTNVQMKSLGHNDGGRRSSGSSDSLHVAEDERSSDEEEVEDVNNINRTDLHLLLDSFFDGIKKIADEKTFLSKMEASCLDKQDFECPLCMRILWEPVTTTCGHTFCRVCLNRCLDHQPTCPLCKASLMMFLAERVQNVTEFLQLAIKTIFPNDYAERKAIVLEEMELLTNAGKDPEHEIPLFICTVALPTVPCPLHVFEPRYRLMIRQCIESGSRQFGMCGVVDDQIAEYGTMLEIRGVQYFPDGRSIVDTVGRKRFRILRRGERDGYHTGAIEFLEDQPLSDIDWQCIEEKHDRTYKISRVWFMHLPTETRHQILEHFGPMPHVESNYTSSPDGPSWLWWMLAILPVETRLKVLLVSLTSLPRRLEFLYRILLHFQSSIVS